MMVDLLSPIVNGASEIFTDLGAKPTASLSLSRFLSNASPSEDKIAKAIKSSSVKPLSPIINELRAFKSGPEIANMRKAGQISGRVFTEAMKQQWGYEKDLQAFVEYWFKRGGCDGSAYVPVVAGGMV